MRQKDLDARMRQEIVRWTGTWAFTRFVTLAFNDSEAGRARLAGSRLSYGFVEERLRKWDAMMNRVVIGRSWHARPEDRLFSFFFLEKPNSNPHWHGVVRFFAEGSLLQKQEAKFDRYAELRWRKLVPSGTVNVQLIHEQEGVLGYVAKALGGKLEFERFVVADQFR